MKNRNIKIILVAALTLAAALLLSGCLGNIFNMYENQKNENIDPVITVDAAGLATWKCSKNAMYEFQINDGEILTPEFNYPESYSYPIPYAGDVLRVRAVPRMYGEEAHEWVEVTYEPDEKYDFASMKLSYWLRVQLIKLYDLAPGTYEFEFTPDDGIDTLIDSFIKLSDGNIVYQETDRIRFGSPSNYRAINFKERKGIRVFANYDNQETTDYFVSDLSATPERFFEDFTDDYDYSYFMICESGLDYLCRSLDSSPAKKVSDMTWMNIDAFFTAKGINLLKKDEISDKRQDYELELYIKHGDTIDKDMLNAKYVSNLREKICDCFNVFSSDMAFWKIFRSNSSGVYINREHGIYTDFTLVVEFDDVSMEKAILIDESIKAALGGALHIDPDNEKIDFSSYVIEMLGTYPCYTKGNDVHHDVVRFEYSGVDEGTSGRVYIEVEFFTDVFYDPPGERIVLTDGIYFYDGESVYKEYDNPEK